MKAGENQKAGPITDFLVKDHGRLESLLQQAVAHADHVDQGAYAQFRAGLLRHIGMEEKFSYPPLSDFEVGSLFSSPRSSGWIMGHSARCSYRLPRPPSSQVSAAFSRSTMFWRKDRGACMKPATT